MSWMGMFEYDPSTVTVGWTCKCGHVLGTPETGFTRLDGVTVWPGTATIPGCGRRKAVEK